MASRLSSPVGSVHRGKERGQISGWGIEKRLAKTKRPACSICTKQRYVRRSGVLWIFESHSGQLGMSATEHCRSFLIRRSCSIGRRYRMGCIAYSQSAIDSKTDEAGNLLANLGRNSSSTSVICASAARTLGTSCAELWCMHNVSQVEALM